jgi:hypothetical protein
MGIMNVLRGLKCKAESRRKDLLTDTGGMYVKEISFDD